MKVRIDEIPEDGLELVLTGEEDVLSVHLGELKPQHGVQIDPHVKGVISLRESEKDVFLTARLQTRISLSCFRCLDRFDLDKEIDLDLVVRRIDKDSSDRDYVVESTANEVWIEGPELDIGPLVAQEFLLEIPMKPICRENCPGLCPRCGALKGSEKCSCPEEDDVDPRWQVLAKLKKEIGP
jgi:uncharacterized protein